MSDVAPTGLGLISISTVVYAVLPYVALSIGIAGLVWRRRTDQFGWSARSTELLESRTLRWASVVFHFGLLAAIGGHVMGILIPQSFTAAIGLTDRGYHLIAVVGGLSAGIAVVIGFAALMYRRARFPRVRVTTTNMDVLVFVLLGIGIATGMLATLTNIADGVHYRESVAPYFREIFILNPDPGLMTQGGVTPIFQIHVTVVWFLYALWPFSRLIHAFTFPINYPRRSPIVYRPRNPGAAGRNGSYGSGTPDYAPTIPADGSTGSPRVPDRVK